MNIRILFIDEEEEQHEIFEEYMYNSGCDIVVECRYPSSSIEEMIQTIEEVKPDAVITDYLLNDHKSAKLRYNVPYTGADLAREFSNIRPGFPCFVLTSFDDQAIQGAADVNIVYLKGVLSPSGDTGKAKFHERIREQIAKYKKSIIDAQIQLSKLIEKRRNNKTTPAEDKRLIELDNFIEKALDASSILPDDMKSTSNIEQLSVMIQKADELLNRLTKL